MNTRNTLSFTNFAAVCSSMLLAGALSAQAADTKPQREPADVTAAQTSDAKLQHHQDQLERAVRLVALQPLLEQRLQRIGVRIGHGLLRALRPGGTPDFTTLSGLGHAPQKIRTPLA